MYSLDYSLNKATKLAIETKSIIEGIYRPSLYNDEPKIYGYVVNYKKGVSTSEEIAAGFSFDKKTALMRALGEGIERYCLENYKPNITFVEAIKSSRKQYKLDPRVLSPFSKEQLKKKSFKQFTIQDSSQFSWSNAFSLTNNKQIVIPTQLISFTYKSIKNEPLIMLPISTGSAAGLSLDNALYRGICEIIERDAFMISYLNMLSSPKIDPHDFELQDILQIYEKYHLELVLLDMTTDLEVPVIAAITIDKTGLGPSVNVGLKAGFDILEVVRGAIEESIMSRSWLRDKFVYETPDYTRKGDIVTTQERAHFWFSVNMLKNLDFWFKNNKYRKIDKKKFAVGKTIKLQKILSILKNKQMEVIYADITGEKIKSYGFCVVKVIIPQLQPLYLDERYQYLGGKRLYNAPIDMGMLKRGKKTVKLNSIPHPFL